MAEITVLTKKKSAIGALVLDAILNESHEFTRTATQFPVEQGAPITDHVRQEPARVTISGIVTNHPIKANRQLSQYIYDVASGKESVIVEQAATRVSGAFDLLMEMIGEMDSYESTPVSVVPVDVVTTLKLYKSMIITNLSITRDTPEESLRFTITLQKIRRATLRTAYVSPIQRTAAGAVGAVDDKNNVADQVSDQEKGAVRSSALYDGAKKGLKGYLDMVDWAEAKVGAQ